MKQWKRRAVCALLAAAACVSFAVPVSAGWKKDGGGWRYETDAGSDLHSEWKQIDGFWYCFDENGYMKTGWEWWEGGWYYLTPDYVSRYPAGAMLIDAEIVSDGKLYALDRGGRMLKNLTHTGSGYSYRYQPDGSIIKHRTADMYRFSVPEGWKVMDMQEQNSSYAGYFDNYLLYPEEFQGDLDRGEQPAVRIEIHESPTKPEEWPRNAEPVSKDNVRVDAGETLLDAYSFETAASADYKDAYHVETVRAWDGFVEVSENVTLARDYLMVSAEFDAPGTIAEAYLEDFRAFAGSFVLLPEEEIPVLLENRYGDGAVWEFDGKAYRLRRADGSYAAGWVYRDGCWYYLGEDGCRRTGWLELADGTYYLRDDGRMITGAAQIGGQLCTFGGDGRLVSRQPAVSLRYELPAGWTAFDMGGAVMAVPEDYALTGSNLLITVLPGSVQEGGCGDPGALEKRMREQLPGLLAQFYGDVFAGVRITSRPLSGAAAGEALEISMRFEMAGIPMRNAVFLICGPDGALSMAVYTAQADEYGARLAEAREIARSVAPVR